MANSREIRTISPVDGRISASESYASPSDIQAAVERATRSFDAWRRSPICERSALVKALAEALKERKEELAEAVAWQIGRPIALADETPRFAIVTGKHVEATKVLHQEAYNAEPGIERFVRREAQGLHLSIAPWNYPVGLLPWLVVAPILGGNVVILKHSDQTAVINRIVQEAYNSIRGPAGVLQTLNMTHKDTGAMIRSGKAKGMNFIGSVRGGSRSIEWQPGHLHMSILNSEERIPHTSELMPSSPSQFRTSRMAPFPIPASPAARWSGSMFTNPSMTSSWSVSLQRPRTGRSEIRSRITLS